MAKTSAKRGSASRTSKRAPAARDIPGAVEAPLPQKLSPQLATLSAAIPTRGEWLYEIKLDGYRLMTRFDQGKPSLITRGGHDWSTKMPALIGELKTLGIRSGWLDGEIVVPGEGGVPDFNALQNSLDRQSSANIVYFLFDIPFLEGYDLRQAQLRDRRQLLESVLSGKATEHVRLSEAFGGGRSSVHLEFRMQDETRGHHRQACQLTLYLTAHGRLAEAQV